MEGGSKE